MENKKNFLILIKNEQTEQAEVAAQADAVLCIMTNHREPNTNIFRGIPSSADEIIKLIDALDTLRQDLLDAAAEVGMKQLREAYTEEELAEILGTAMEEDEGEGEKRNPPLRRMAGSEDAFFKRGDEYADEA